MDYLKNPFTPTFGEAPLHLAGRRGLLGNLNRAYGRLARDPFLTTLVSGARGTGKTSYRLLEQGLIEEPETSVVTFALPVLREYVAERQEKN